MKSLFFRAVAGLIFLVIVIGLLIFFPARTLNFPAGWIYFLVFSVSITIISFYFLKNNPALVDSRTRVGPSAETEMSQKIIQSFSSFFFVALLALPGFDHRFGWSHVPFALVIFSNLMALLGFAGIFRVMLENSFLSSTIEVAEGQKVISTGPYAIVRHPMYSAAFVLLGFTPLALGSYWDLIFAVGIVTAIIFRLLDEEKYLSKNLPGYSEYMLKTKYRLLPGIW
jgi:protein-S-isoprenylcysteine O-methyltransferase Ste14